jgi:hypothetical protein
VVGQQATAKRDLREQGEGLFECGVAHMAGFNHARRPALHVLAWLGAVTLLAGCATISRRGVEEDLAQQTEAGLVNQLAALSPAEQERILALNIEQVTAQDLREALSNAPAPQILNIHGGIYPVHLCMVSFSEFLVGMGYPERSIRNPADGTCSFSCYESSAKIAGVAAWYYEKTGLRPMLVGHSQGGMQLVKVLHQFARKPSSRLHVWNPLTWENEKRCEIRDPLTGSMRPVVGLQFSYATAVGAGGFTRFLPNQWDTFTRLRSIPDSVEEFTGFYHHLDPLGGDFFGFGSANCYHANGKAVVRNVQLPVGYNHVTVPNTRHLLKSKQIMDWINNYRPSDKAFDSPQVDVRFDSESSHIVWAADVWHSIKKHWVLELQRLIRTQRAKQDVH